MSDNHWFSDIDEEKAGQSAQWQPCLQVSSVMCLPLPVWFCTEGSCAEFIKSDIIGAEHRPL